jgi:hypothetical protein
LENQQVAAGQSLGMEVAICAAKENTRDVFFMLNKQKQILEQDVKGEIDENHNFRRIISHTVSGNFLCHASAPTSF